MRHLGLALFAEGPTDHDFLRPVLRRLCEDLCVSRGRELVEITDVQRLPVPSRVRDDDRATRIVETARAALGSWDVLFIHTDGNGDAESARAERVAPAGELILQQPGAEWGRPVGVVPVRETEAWALSDGDCLREAFGATASDDDMGVPRRAPDVEHMTDPKQALYQAFLSAHGGGGRRRRQAPNFLESIGERVSLERLALVPAFARVRDDLVETLKLLRYLV